MPILDENKFLKTSELTKGDQLTIVSKGEWIESTFKNQDGTNKKQFRILVEISAGEIRKTNLNKESRVNLCKAWNNNTDTWEGKVMEVEGIYPLRQLGEGKNMVIFKAAE